MAKDIECSLYKNKRNNQYTLHLSNKQVRFLSDVKDPKRVIIKGMKFIK